MPSVTSYDRAPTTPDRLTMADLSGQAWADLIAYHEGRARTLRNEAMARLFRQAWVKLTGRKSHPAANAARAFPA